MDMVSKCCRCGKVSELKHTLAHVVLEVVPLDVVGEVADVDTAVLLGVLAVLHVSLRLVAARGSTVVAVVVVCGRALVAVVAALLAVAGGRARARTARGVLGGALVVVGLRRIVSHCATR